MADSWQGIRVSFRSQARYLDPLRTIVAEATKLAGLDEQASGKVVLAVQEACANVIRHCYGGREDGRIDLILTFADEHLEIRIDDYGEWVDPENIKGRDLCDVKPGGLGVHFMKSVMDEVEYLRNEWGGTSLKMTKRVPPKDPSGVTMDW